MSRPTLTIKDITFSDCEVQLDGQTLKLKSYTIYRDAKTSNIILDLGYHDVEMVKEIQSDDVIFVKWRGMTFQRVDMDDEMIRS